VLPRSSSIRSLLTVATASSVLVAVAGCAPEMTFGSHMGGANMAELTSIPHVAVDARLTERLPGEIRTGGINIATSSNLPPMTFIAPDDKTQVGFDVDMAREIGAALGVKTQVSTVGFDTLIPGLQSRRYTMALSSLGITEERTKVVDFVSYYSGGQGFLASRDSQFTVKELTDLCGHHVAVTTGSTQQSTLEDSRHICPDAGRDPYQLDVFPTTDAAVLALSSNRTDVLYASISIVNYTAKQSEKFRIAGRYKRAPVGVALPKGSPLTPVVADAVQAIIDQGAYRKLLDRWGLTDNAVAKAEVVTQLPPA